MPRLPIAILAALLAVQTVQAQEVSTAGPVNEVVDGPLCMYYGTPTREDIQRLCIESITIAIERCRRQGGEPVPGPGIPYVHVWEEGASCQWSIGCFFRDRLTEK